MTKGRIFLFLMVAVAGMRVSVAADSVVEELRRQWQSTRSLVTGLAEAIPENKYDYRPTPEVRSFREQLQHVVGENYMFMGMAAGEKPPVPVPPENLKTRAELLKALSESYDYGTKVLAALTDKKALEAVPGFGGQKTPRLGIVINNLKDNMDHYGNMVTYLRLNGLVPPRSAPRP